MSLGTRRFRGVDFLTITPSDLVREIHVSSACNFKAILLRSSIPSTIKERKKKEKEKEKKEENGEKGRGEEEEEEKEGGGEERYIFSKLIQ